MEKSTPSLVNRSPAGILLTSVMAKLMKKGINFSFGRCSRYYGAGGIGLGGRSNMGFTRQSVWVHWQDILAEAIT